MPPLLAPVKYLPFSEATGTNPDQTKPAKNKPIRILRRLPDGHEPVGQPTAVPISSLINTLNKLNFTGNFLYVCLRHQDRKDDIIYIPARPMPCDNDRLDCTWLPEVIPPADFNQFHATGFLLKDSGKAYSTKAAILRSDDAGISFDLTEADCQAAKSPTKSSKINITIGLPDLSATGFLTAVEDTTIYCTIVYGAPHSYGDIEPGAKASITISNHRGGIIFEGECLITSTEGSQKCALEILGSKTEQFSPRKYRSSRRELTPSPKLRFTHPLTGELITLDIINLSGAGLAAKSDQEIFLPIGLNVPEMTIFFSNTFKAAINARIIYEKKYIDIRNCSSFNWSRFCTDYQ